MVREQRTRKKQTKYVAELLPGEMTAEVDLAKMKSIYNHLHEVPRDEDMKYLMVSMSENGITSSISVMPVRNGGGHQTFFWSRKRGRKGRCRRLSLRRRM